MKRALNSAVIAASILLFFLILPARSSCAFRLPQETQEEALRVQVQNLNDSVKAERVGILIILVILVLSAATNVLLIINQFRIQKQVSESLEAIRTVNMIKETAARFSIERARTIPGGPEDGDDAESGPDDIQILRSGF